MTDFLMILGAALSIPVFIAVTLWAALEISLRRDAIKAAQNDGWKSFAGSGLWWKVDSASIKTTHELVEEYKNAWHTRKEIDPDL